MSRLMLMVAGLFAVACASPNWAMAHAILLESQPAARSTVAPGPCAVTLRFNSRIDHARSRLTLRSSPTDDALAASAQPEKPLTLDPASPVDVLATTAILAPGRYILRWQVLAVDGHITRGDVPLTVQAP